MYELDLAYKIKNKTLLINRKLDAQIIKLIGKDSSSSGTGPKLRNIQFEFDKKEDAKSAAKKLTAEFPNIFDYIVIS